jgi:Tol biopolymer transport system component
LCLEKDVRQRRQSAGDVRIDLAHALASPTEPAHRPSSRRALALAGGGALIALAVVAVVAVPYLRGTPRELRLDIVTPSTRQPLDFSLSPDGRHIAYVAPDASEAGIERLYVRALDDTEPRPLAGTEGAYHPFWSPDSRSIAFFAAEGLLRLDIAGGTPQFIADAAYGWGGAWGADGTILFAPWATTPLMRVSATGGQPIAATQLDLPRQQGHRYPSFLPDGRRFLFFSQGEAEFAGIYLGSLDGGTPKRLTAADTAGVFVAPDRVVYRDRGALIARRFDVGRGELVGDPVTVAKTVGTDGNSFGAISASATNVIAYRAAAATALQATWFDREGTVLGEPTLRSNEVALPALSHDDRRIAFEDDLQGNRDVWIADQVRGDFTRLTNDPGVDGAPIFSPDSSQIAFASFRRGSFDVWKRSASGQPDEELLVEGPQMQYPLDWSKDGRFLLYQWSDFNEAWDLWAVPMTGDDREPFVVAGSPQFAERMGQFSPDGRFVAYETNESGRSEIVLQAFPQPQGRVPVSTAGGTQPRFSPDGREIFFVAPDGRLMAAPVTPLGATLEVGTPAGLFAAHIATQRLRAAYAVASDGRFLVISVSPADEGTSPITLIVDWRH